MAKNINLKRYKELLRLEPLKNGDSLSDEIFFEFLDYIAKIQSQVTYNRKEQYFSVIHNYLSGILVPYEFRLKFLRMEREDAEAASVISKDFEALKTFTIADNLDNFSRLRNQISTLCFDFDEIVDDGSGPRMTETEFYSLVNNYYYKFQKFVSIPLSNNLPYEKLIVRSLNMLTLIILSEIVLVLFYLFIVTSFEPIQIN